MFFGTKPLKKIKCAKIISPKYHLCVFSRFFFILPTFKIVETVFFHASSLVLLRRFRLAVNNMIQAKFSLKYNFPSVNFNDWKDLGRLAITTMTLMTRLKSCVLHEWEAKICHWNDYGGGKLLITNWYHGYYRKKYYD